MTNFTNRSLHDLDIYSKEQMMQILQTSKVMKEINSRVYKKVPALRGKTVCTLFVQNSTRTRISFQIAANRLSADVVSFQQAGSALSKGESLQDTAMTLNAMGVDLFIPRHSQVGASKVVQTVTGKPVINAGDGIHAHPTQALLDMFTIWETLGTLEGVNVTIVGDIIHSRVVRSNIIGLQKMGANVTVCGPLKLVPYDFHQKTGALVRYSLNQALIGADIVMPLRLQLERHSMGDYPSLEEYNKEYTITTQTIKWARPNAYIMHPGPINRGTELTSQVADSQRSLILQQVANGVSVRMALLYLILGGSI